MIRWAPKFAGLGLLAAFLLAPSPASATRKVENYPKVALYTQQVGDMTLAQLDTLSWYDDVFLMEGPTNVARVRANNPDVELFYLWMPQNIVKWSEGSTTWYPDTTWSITRLAQLYADKNDWYLRDTAGNRIPEWYGYAANWTRYCKKGTYGTSKGMTYVEWLTSVAIPQITKQSPRWQPWGRGASSYDGLMLEIMADCVGSFGWQTYQNADPDRDGLAEGVYSTCTMGGWSDSLSVLYREQNEIFHQHLYDALPSDCMVLMNAANKYVNPSWWTDVSGVKLESWMEWPNPIWQDWWDWFYGLRDYNGQELWGPGYRWAENNLHHSGDPDEGWEHTLLQIRLRPSWTQAEAQRMKRFGLGTSMLGEGYFMFTKDEHGLMWQPEYEWDFGQSLGGFTRETYSRLGGVDTLYVRSFAKGFIEVNPNPRVTNGVAVQDTRFGMWNTVLSVNANATGDDSVEVSFIMPGSTQWPTDNVDLRYSTSPITADNWANATAYSGNPISGPQGTQISRTVSGLNAATPYYFALKNRVHGRREPGISSLGSATTDGSNGGNGGGGGGGGGGGSDQTAPAAIQDLASVSEEANRVRLTWTASGDDGATGQATSYQMRRRTGGPITSEAQWSSATVIANPPTPGSSGAMELFWVSGLSPATTYGFAVRAVDEVGNVGALSNAMSATTRASDPPPPPPDTTPPAPLADLAVVAVGTDWVDLQWTATGDDGVTGRATSFRVRALLDHSIDTEARWNSATNSPTTPPTPGVAGTVHTLRFTGLSADKLYGFAARAVDDAGNVSNLGPELTAHTEASAPTLDTEAPATVLDLTVIGSGDTWIQFRWTAPGDDGSTGTASEYRMRALLGRGITTEAQWGTASTPPDPLPLPAVAGTVQTFRWNGLSADQVYGFALRAVDDAANVGRLSPPLTASTHHTNVAPPRTTDLGVASIDSLSVTLTWTAPHDGEGGAVTRYEIGVLPNAAINGDLAWLMSTRREGPSTPRAPGGTETFVVDGLTPSSLYGFALRSFDAEGLGSVVSVGATTRTNAPPPPVDDEDAPPNAVEDLSATLRGADACVLRWTTPRHARTDRHVASYLLHRRRVARVGVELLPLGGSEEDSVALSDHGARAADQPDSVTLDALAPESDYTFRLTAIDDAGHRSAAGNSVTLETPAATAPPDTLAPAAVANHELLLRTPRRALLRWTAVGDDGMDGTASRYVIGVLSADVPVNETSWSDADTTRFLAPAPVAALGSMELDLLGLAPDTRYGLAIRAWDEAGNLSPLDGAWLDFQTAPLPDTLPPSRVADLRVVARGESTLTLAFTAPSDSNETEAVASYELRMREGGPVSNEEDWATASSITPLPTPHEPGQTESVVIDGLSASTRYGFALRARDENQLLSLLSNAAFDSTLAPPPPPPPVDLPPAAIADLSAGVRASDRVSLSWTAVGADSLQGTATAYALRLLLGRPFTSEADWDDAFAVDGLPAPEPPGTAEQFVLLGLDPELSYGVALRAIDAAGQLSPWAPGLFVPRYEAPPPPPLPDPPPVVTLSIEAIEARSARLRFTHPVVPEGGPPLARYQVVLAAIAIDSLNWASFDTLGGAPAPGVAGTEATMNLASLAAETSYHVAVRVIDRLGRASRPSVDRAFTTASEPDLAPPDPPGSPIARAASGGAVHLSWEPSSDPRVTGYHVYGAALHASFARLTDAPVTSEEWDVPSTLARDVVRYAVTAVIAGGDESGLSPEAAIPSGTFQVAGPFPHPVTDQLRLRITPGAADRPISIALFDLMGHRVKQLFDGLPSSSLEFDVTWDRRVASGGRAAPGFYYLKIKGEGTSELRTIYLAP